MSSPTVYFVTGANRGIGLGLVAHLVNTGTNVYVFAGARNSSPALEELAASQSTKLSIVSFVAANESSNREAAKVVSNKFGRVDTVLNVAAICNFLAPIEETPQAQIMDHFKTNVIGNVVLFQAFASLLRKSENPKFIPLSSAVGSLSTYTGFPTGLGCYGSSKAALNYIARRIHFENEWITCFPLSPGLVATDMTLLVTSTDASGIAKAYVDAKGRKPEVAAAMLVPLIESATRDTHGGEFWDITGEEVGKLLW